MWAHVVLQTRSQYPSKLVTIHTSLSFFFRSRCSSGGATPRRLCVVSIESSISVTTHAMFRGTNLFLATPRLMPAHTTAGGVADDRVSSRMKSPQRSRAGTPLNATSSRSRIADRRLWYRDSCWLGLACTIDVWFNSLL